MNPDDLNDFIKRLASEQGFDRCGIARATSIGRADYFRAWLSSGRAGSMDYLHRYSDKRVDPTTLLPGAKGVIVVALLYGQAEPTTSDAASTEVGRVAKYAWGEDYHKVVKDQLFILLDQLRAQVAEPFEAKVCVDTAPIIEREMAAAAGVGWIAKNTMVIDPELGSYFFLGVIVTTLELTPDEPMPDHCGTCTACLDACPTGAFPAPYEMDASRCISYLTIEHRNPIPPEFHAQIGDWIFGCDVCQQVCPHNRDAPTTRELRFKPRQPSPHLKPAEIVQWSIDEYRKHLKGSAIKRAKLDMLQRNARIVERNRIASSKTG